MGGPTQSEERVGEGENDPPPLAAPAPKRAEAPETPKASVQAILDSGTIGGSGFDLDGAIELPSDAEVVTPTTVTKLDARPRGVAIVVTEDSYVRGGAFRENNYATAPELTVKLAPRGFMRIAFMRFDLSGLREISRATLFLTVKEVNIDGSISALWEAPESWDAETLKFTNRPLLGGQIGPAFAVQSVGVIGLDVTEVAERERQGDGSLSLAVRAISEGAKTDWRFASMESGDPPVIIVD